MKKILIILLIIIQIIMVGINLNYAIIAEHGQTNTYSGTADASIYGTKNTVSANKQSAFGYQNTITSGTGSSSFGYYNSIDAPTSIIVGYNNKIESSCMGMCSAVGAYNEIYGGAQNAAFGFSNKVSGEWSSGLGIHNQVYSEVSTAVGMYNILNSDYTSAFGIYNNDNGHKIQFGGGESHTNRKNLASIDSTGNFYLEGSIMGTGADYAEYFDKEENIEKNNLVGLNIETGLVRNYKNGDIVIGIVSTNPAVIGNSFNSNYQTLKEWEIDKVLVGLLGQMEFNKSQVLQEGRKIFTKDKQFIGYLLGNGKLYLK